MHPFEPEQSESNQAIHATTLPPEGLFSGPPYAPLPTSHKKLIHSILITIVVVAIVGVAYWAYQQYLTPVAMARTASNTYVAALATDNVDQAAYMSNKDADFSLLESASQSVKGTYRLADTGERSGAYYFLYTLSNTSNKYARTIVVKTAKGFRVSSFVYSAIAISLVPDSAAISTPGGVGSVGNPVASSGADSGASNASSGSGFGAAVSSNSGPASTPIPSLVSAACLAQSDYTSVFDDGAQSNWSAVAPYTVRISFISGTADYIDDFEIGDLYAQWLKFYQANPNKDYTIHITGATTAALNDLTLASKRADTSRAALTSVGIPGNKLVRDAPTIVMLEQNSTEDGYVTLSIVPGPRC